MGTANRRKSPMSQNSMPRRFLSGDIASSRLISAPQPAAITTPGQQQPAGCRVRPVDGQPEHKDRAEQCSGQCCAIDRSCSPAPAIRASIAPSADRGAAGGAEHVRIRQRVAQQHLHHGAGQGECRHRCRRLRVTRCSRRFSTISRSTGSPLPADALPRKSRLGLPVVPAASAANALAQASAASSGSRSQGFMRGPCNIGGGLSDKA